MDDYESWTRTEIAAAQARVDDLQRALGIFLAWKTQQSAGFNGAAKGAKSSQHTANAQSSQAVTRQRASKNDAIFAAFEAAGPDGLSQEDVQRIAADAGLNTNPNALRALCWTAKKAGRLISIAPGRYAIPQKNEAAVENLSEGETAAPTREPHNQHREGDEGGGI